MAAGNGFGFESGANGDALTTTNAGVDAIGSPVSGTMTISTAQKAHGTRSALMTAGTASGVTYISKTIIGTDTLTVHLYVRFTALPSGTISPCLVWLGAGTSQLVNLEVTATTGLLRIRDDASANAWTSTTSFALNTWYRIDFSVLRNASTGTVRVAYYLLDSTTAIEDSGTITGKNTGASSITTLRMGMKCATGTMEAVGYVDDWDYDPTTLTFMPPYVDTLATPVVTLGATTQPTTVGGTNGSQVVTWPAVSGAVSYEAWRSSLASPEQSDFTLVATGVTSPYTFTGLPQDPDGRAYGIKAKG